MDDKEKEGKATEQAAKETAPEKETQPANDAQDGTSTEGQNEDEAEPAEPDMVARANLAADKLKAENDRADKRLAKEEKLLADTIAAGKGKLVPSKEKPKLTDREYAKEVIYKGDSEDII